MNLKLLLWRLFVGWQKVWINSHSLNGMVLNITKITKWEKLQMDYHNSQVKRKDWVWWKYSQYNSEISLDKVGKKE